ncbi:MAG: hypothetical protein NC041_10185 [Bacteroides sp.]|nr:hypothetical protein [Prevotella sp.]MCM1406850.1 hypothetical protein [Treponema brennaborense]MCM1470821.1 hypothetical protein [Bacteroides sp.]
MKIKKSCMIFVIPFAVIFLIYMIFAGKPLGMELQLEPLWSVDVREQSEQNGETGAVLPFQLGKHAGYFRPDGTIASYREVRDRVAVSAYYTADYAADSKKITVQRNDGTVLCELPEAGFPFFSGERIFMFPAGGSSFARYDVSGELLWRHENYVPLVCFSSSDAGCIAGFADGSLQCFGNDGAVRFSTEPGGSDYPIILGTDISDSGKYAACVSGINRQRFVLLQISGQRCKTVFHEYFDDNIAEQLFVKFTEDESAVYFNYSGGLGIVDCGKLTAVHIPLNGKILAVEDITDVQVSFVLCRTADSYHIYIIERRKSLAGSFSFKADQAFISVKDNLLFIGKDTAISCLRIVRG